MTAFNAGASRAGQIGNGAFPPGGAIRGPSRLSTALDPEPKAQADHEPTLNDTCRTPSAMRVCGSRGNIVLK